MLYRQSTELFADSGLKLMKWSANAAEIMQIVPQGMCAPSSRLIATENSSSHVHETMGLQWDPTTDALSLATKKSKAITNTRRGMLSDLHSFFDPIGFTSPFLLRGKLIYQTCLVSFPDLGWDDVLTPRIMEKWKYFVNQLQGLCKLKIPRWCTGLSTASDVTLHVFCDVSAQAYGAAAYFVNENCMSFILVKSCVVP